MTFRIGDSDWQEAARNAEKMTQYGLALAKEKGPAPIMNEEFTVTRAMLRKRPEMARDGWKIDACPVNGPAVAAAADTVVVAWFTAADMPRVRLAYSRDGGRSFAAPIEVASGAVGAQSAIESGASTTLRVTVSWLVVMLPVA